MRCFALFLATLVLGCSDARRRSPPHSSTPDASNAAPDAPGPAHEDASPMLPPMVADDAGWPSDRDDAALDAPDAHDAADVEDAAPLPVCEPIADPCEDSTVVRGDVSIETPEDVSALSGVTCIDGDVRLAGDTIREITLPSLRRITGGLLGQFLGALETIELACVERVGSFVLIGNDRLTALRMPRLARSDRIALRGGAAFATLDVASLERAASISLWELPSLVRADLDRLAMATDGVEASGLASLTELRLGALRTGSIDIEDDDVLERLDLPSLEMGSLLVQETPALRVVSAPVLREAERVAIYGARSLEVIRLGALQTVGRSGLRIGGATATESLDLASLERVTGSLEITFSRMPSLRLPQLVSVGHTGLGFIPEGDLGVSDTQLAFIEAPLLRTVYANVRVTRNGTLTRLDLPALTAAASVTITDNPRLPQCEVERRFAPLRAHVAGNDTTVVCDELLPALEIGCASCRDHFRTLVDSDEVCVTDGRFRIETFACLGCPIALACRATVRDGDAHQGSPHVDLVVQADACACSSCGELATSCPLPDDLVGAMDVYLNGTFAFTLPAGESGCFAVRAPQRHMPEVLCE